MRIILSRFGGAVLVLLVSLSGCATTPPKSSEIPLSWPTVKIAVFSDVHVYAPTLGMSGPDWQAMVARSFELRRESSEILRTVVSTLIEQRPDLVLVPGDLTAEGERESHEFVASQLSRLRTAGIPVLVVPGNHDVLNPSATGYTEPHAQKVTNVTPEQFSSLYADCGYNQALSRDPVSLSYCAEPVRGLRVLALDTARWEENLKAGRQVTGGRIREASWPWIRSVLSQAALERVPVIVMMHHGLVEKFPSQDRLFFDYLVRDRQSVARELGAYGVRVVLTGHFHTLSIASAGAEASRLLDIEDGTLTQFPLGYRELSVGGTHLSVRTRYVTDLPSWSDRPGEFLSYARSMVETHLPTLVEERLVHAGASVEEARILAQPFTEAYLSFTQGNAEKPASWTWPPRGLGVVGTAAVVLIGDSAENLWKPRFPDDLSLDWDLGVR